MSPERPSPFKDPSIRCDLIIGRTLRRRLDDTLGQTPDGWPEGAAAELLATHLYLTNDYWRRGAYRTTYPEWLHQRLGPQGVPM